MVVKYWIVLYALLFTGISYAQHPTLQKANDFVYMQADGTQHTLYALQSEMILLYFYDPTCEDCHKLMEQLNTSETVNHLISEKRLLVLAIYPEEDLELWEPYRTHLPSTWINGYDKGATINMEGLYSLTSLPTLYLLDSEKNNCMQAIVFEDIERELTKRSN